MNGAGGVDVAGMSRLSTASADPEDATVPPVLGRDIDEDVDVAIVVHKIERFTVM